MGTPGCPYLRGVWFVSGAMYTLKLWYRPFTHRTIQFHKRTYPRFQLRDTQAVVSRRVTREDNALYTTMPSTQALPPTHGKWKG